jgi:virginiamycin B lyase
MRIFVVWLCLIQSAPSTFSQNPPAEEKIVRPGVKEVQRPYSSLKPSATFHVGENAYWVLIATDAVWVAGAKPFNLQRIDPSTNRVVATLDLAAEACSGLEIGFGSIWVPLCTEKPSLARIDLRTNKLVATLAVGPGAPEGGIAASKDSIWLVTDDRGTLSRIDPSTNSVSQSIKIPPGATNPIFSDGIVWITSPKTNVLIAVDADKGTVVGEIPVGPKPQFLTDGGGSIWTLNQGDGTVTRVDSKTRQVVATIRAGIPGPGGDICYGAGSVWATVFDVPLTQVDLAKNKVVKQWVGPGGDSMRYGFDSLWITDYFHGWLWRIPLKELEKM